jgi:hypothetical protein
MNLMIDWLWLYVQVLLLVWVGFREFIRPHGRNVYAIALVGATLVLVHGQMWWMFSEFTKQDTVVISHLRKTINLHGARLANVYIGLSVLCFFITYMILSHRKSSVPVNMPIYDKSVAISKLNGFLLSVWVLFFGIVAVNCLGGFKTILTKPGQFFGHGATMFLVLVHVGRLQLLDKISRMQKIIMIDILLFGSIVIFQLFNGRGWTLFFYSNC